MAELAKNAMLEVRGLKKYFPVRRGLLQRQVGWVKAVDGVDFALEKGKIMGLVGESGCGKTTTGRMVLRALDPTEGEILFRKESGAIVDMVQLSNREIKEVRSEMQMIFQDPYSSLNPRMPVLDLIAEPLVAHGWSSRDCEVRVTELMERVGLDPRYIRRYPHAFSGGQRQRIGIARALALSPSLIVADEPVSALDVSVQAQILNLLQQLQQDLNLTLLFVAHDLSVVRYLCDEVAVMYAGRMVERAPAHDLFAMPRHPYTQALIATLPRLGHPQSRFPAIPGTVPDARVRGEGCGFAERCPLADAACRDSEPALITDDEGRAVACFKPLETSALS